MRSGEVARLAGVSVRALRHYHHVGVLTEPERDTNGYRHYDVHDLVRVLRIKRLASLGVALERIPAVLDDGATDSGMMLAQLDSELAAQIERLSAQRALIAKLREMDAAPDLPPALAPYLGAFAAAGLSPELARLDRDQSVLLAHLAGAEGLTHLVRLYERLSDPSLAPAIADLTSRFSELDAMSADQDTAGLVDDLAELLGPLVAEFSTAGPPVMVPAAAGLLGALASDALNPTQHDVLGRLEARFDPRPT